VIGYALIERAVSKRSLSSIILSELQVRNLLARMSSPSEDYCNGYSGWSTTLEYFCRLELIVIVTIGLKHYLQHANRKLD
jgi:hypothetical protein